MEEGTTQATSSNSKVIWYVIGGLVVLGLLGSFMMRGVGYMGMRAAGIDVDRNMDGSATYTGKEGSVTVGGNKMPDNWPSDAPANVAGAAISYSGTSNPQTGQSGSAVMYTVRGDVEAIAAHYKLELQSKGWTVEQTANMGGALIIAAKKDTRTFGAYVIGGENGEVTVQASISM